MQTLLLCMHKKDAWWATYYQASMSSSILSKKVFTMAQQRDDVPAGGKYRQTVAPFDIDIQAVYQLGIQTFYQLKLFSIPKRLS